MTAIGWDPEDYPEEACTGPCCHTTPTDKPHRPGLLTRLRLTLRMPGKAQPDGREHTRTSDTDVVKAVIKDQHGAFTVLYGMYGANATAVATGATATIDVTPVIALGVRSMKVALVLGPTRAIVEQTLERDFGPLPFTCLQCGRPSYHPQDKQYGYCGACHAHTGEPT